MTDNKLSALIVDDEIDILELMTFFLDEKFHCVCENDVRKAMREVEEKTFDVVISDYKMSDINGLEFLRYVRKISPKTKIFLMSGAMIDFSLEAPDIFNEMILLEKPFSDPKQILNTVVAAIDKSY